MNTKTPSRISENGEYTLLEDEIFNGFLTQPGKVVQEKFRLGKAMWIRVGGAHKDQEEAGEDDSSYENIIKLVDTLTVEEKTRLLTKMAEDPNYFLDNVDKSLFLFAYLVKSGGSIARNAAMLKYVLKFGGGEFGYSWYEFLINHGFNWDQISVPELQQLRVVNLCAGKAVSRMPMGNKEENPHLYYTQLLHMEVGIHLDSCLREVDKKEEKHKQPLFLAAQEYWHVRSQANPYQSYLNLSNGIQHQNYLKILTQLPMDSLPVLIEYLLELQQEEINQQGTK